jgi:hypothetical protein
MGRLNHIPLVREDSAENDFTAEEAAGMDMLPLITKKVGLDAKVYSLSGLFVDELPDALIVDLARKGEIALDLQAKLRYSEAGTFALTGERDMTPCNVSSKGYLANQPCTAGHGRGSAYRNGS